MAYTKAQLEAIKNTLLASNQPILANQHREQIQSMIDEMYDAQSRADILVGVQADTITGGSDTFIVFRNGEAYQIPLSLLSANTLANLGDVFITNVADGETLVYNAVAQRWENQNIFLGFALSNLEDVQLTSLANGDILRYNSTSEKWENTSLATILSPYALLTDLNAYQLLSQKGQANGYAQLDTGAKLPISIIPDSVLGQVEYQGTWNAATNTPTLPATPLKKGDYYVVSADGTQFGIDFLVGDWIISNGTVWEKVDNTDAVTSVFGRLGNIVANASDYSAFYVTLDTGQNITAPKTFSGSITVEQGVRLVTEGTALQTVLKNINSESITTSGSNGFGFNNANNIYFAGSDKGGGILAWNNTAIRTYTLPNATGTIALTSDLAAYLPLSGGTLTGALNGNTTATFNGDIQTNSRFLSFNGGEFIVLQPNAGGTLNEITASSGLPLRITTGSSIGLAAGSLTPQFTLGTNGVVTLTGALNGTSASFSGLVNVQTNLVNSTTYGSLAVQRTGESAINILGTSFSSIYFGDSSNHLESGIVYDHSTNALEFRRSGNSTALTIASTGAATFSSSVTATSASIGYTSAAPTNGMIVQGNVGIGTTAPSVRGHINNDSSGLPATSGTTQTNGVLRLSSSATSGIIDFGMNGDNPWIQSTASTALNNNYNLLLNPNGGNVGIGTDSPATSAILDLTSTTGALLLPRMTTTQRDALTAVNGMVLYNTTTNKIQGREGGEWVDLNFFIS